MTEKFNRVFNNFETQSNLASSSKTWQYESQQSLLPEAVDRFQLKQEPFVEKPIEEVKFPVDLHPKHENNSTFQQLVVPVPPLPKISMNEVLDWKSKNLLKKFFDIGDIFQNQEITNIISREYHEGFRNVSSNRPDLLEATKLISMIELFVNYPAYPEHFIEDVDRITDIREVAEYTLKRRDHFTRSDLEDSIFYINFIDASDKIRYLRGLVLPGDEGIELEDGKEWVQNYIKLFSNEPEIHDELKRTLYKNLHSNDISTREVATLLLQKSPRNTCSPFYFLLLPIAEYLDSYGGEKTLRWLKSQGINLKTSKTQEDQLIKEFFSWETQYQDLLKSRHFLQEYRNFLSSPSKQKEKVLSGNIHKVLILENDEDLRYLPEYQELNSKIQSVPKIRVKRTSRL